MTTTATSAARSPPATPVSPVARFADLFRFTGNGHEIDADDITKSVRDPFRGLPTLPFNWIIEWDRMSNKLDPNEAHMARSIDTRLVDPIHNMVNEGTEADIQDDAGKPIRQLLRSLAQRNLLRGYGLSVPTGQAMAAAMNVPVMSAAELQQGNSDAVNQALTNGGFVEHSPLWFYVLKEAEVRANGNSLGELGSRIVVETQVGLMRHDPSSYLNDSDGRVEPVQGREARERHGGRRPDRHDPRLLRIREARGLSRHRACARGSGTMPGPRAGGGDGCRSGRAVRRVGDVADDVAAEQIAAGQVDHRDLDDGVAAHAPRHAGDDLRRRRSRPRRGRGRCTCAP